MRLSGGYMEKVIFLDFDDYEEELLPFLVKTDFYNGGLEDLHIEEILDYFGDIEVEKFLRLS